MATKSQQRAFYAALGALSTGAYGAAIAMFSTTLMIAIPGLLIPGMLFVAAARWIVRYAPTYKTLTTAAQNQAWGWLSAATGAHFLLAVLFEIRPELSALWGLMLAALALVSWGIGGAWRHIAREHATRQQAAPRTGAPAPAGGVVIHNPNAPATAAGHNIFVEQLDHYAAQFKSALKKMKLHQLLVIKAEKIRDDGTSMRYLVRKPTKAALAAGGEKAEQVTLNANSAEAVAMAMQEELQVPISPNWVSIEPAPDAAGTYEITVNTRDVMRDVYPYVDDNSPISVYTPLLGGYKMDGSEIYKNVRGHSMHVGQTESGKSSDIHCLIGHLTRCPTHELNPLTGVYEPRQGGAVVWACGTEKLYDAFGQWVDPYSDDPELGRPELQDVQVPIDWIAYGRVHATIMLRSLLEIARYRQKLPLGKRKFLPDIHVIIDEASFFLGTSTFTVVYDGSRVNGSWLASGNTRGSASAGGFCHFATQQATNNNLGTYGSQINANMQDQSVFATSDAAEIGRAFGNSYYKLPPPRNPGENWYASRKQGTEPLRIKSRYMQSADTSKPKLHNGDTVADVAAARSVHRRELDEGSAQVAGTLYAQRPRYGNEVRDYLMADPVDKAPKDNATVIDLGARKAATSKAAVTDEEEEITETERGRREALAQVDADFQRLFGNLAGQDHEDPDDLEDEEEVGGNGEPITRADMVSAWMNQAPDRVYTADDVLGHLTECGINTNRTQVSKLLSQMATSARVLRVPGKRGEYKANPDDMAATA